MKILYHHRTRASGADGNHIRQMIKALKRHGHEVDVISPPGVDIWNPPAFAGGKRSGRRSAGAARELVEFLYTFYSWARMGAALARRPGYSFIYERYAIFSWPGAFWARKRRIPLILEVNFTSRTPSNVYPARSGFFKRLEDAIDRWVFNRADAIVVVTQVLKEHLVESFKLTPEKIRVVANAVDPDEFHPGVSVDGLRERLVVNGSRIVGFVGGFYPWHGVDLLIKAAQEILALRSDVVFVLVGEGHLKGHFEGLVQSQGLGPAFRFTGFVPHAALPQYVALFDVGVLPHTNTFGCPMKVLEYMGMAKPVVAPRVPTLEEIMTDGKEGILFESGSSAALAQAIVRILSDREGASRLGEAGRARVERLHTWTRNGREVLALYDWVMWNKR
ncbi:MAG: glycosyltransferase family 4 protein [Candidatus Omnitrophica bacterium]|nr:glycosyltransferase family 4 protein [Candidatus Omnitrophota bacterium]